MEARRSFTRTPAVSRQRTFLEGSLGTPRGLGLGLATATTSAAFFPHCEHRIRCASAASVTERPAILASAFGLDVPGRTAGTRDAHEEIPGAIIEPLDVRQHAHGRMVLTAGEGVHEVPAGFRW